MESKSLTQTLKKTRSRFDIITHSKELRNLIESKLKAEKLSAKKICDAIALDHLSFHRWMVSGRMSFSGFISHKSILDFCREIGIEVRIKVVNHALDDKKRLLYSYEKEYTNK